MTLVLALLRHPTIIDTLRLYDRSRPFQPRLTVISGAHKSPGEIHLQIYR